MADVSAGIVVGGKYRLEEPIGRGGMASIWRATHTLLENSVAVKFLETFGTSRDKMAKRFLREAKLAGGLKHRNVVHILDYGVMDDGQPFMVMELLEGTSLADRLEDGPALSDVEVCDVVAKVLSGLAAVHDAGIVHRDVKPDNIFLVRDADGDYPKLLDFGISRGLDGDGTDTRVTSTGAVIGTPLYMSPEQARGMTDIDRRTDLWSVGMVLWEGLTGGDLPFEAEHMGDVLIRVATETVPSIADVRPDLPPEAVELIARALQRDRSARFQDAREMRAAVLAAADAIAANAGAPRPPRPAATASQKIDVVVARTGEIEPPRSARRWPLFAGIAAITVTSIVVGFIALGGSIHFSSAEAAPRPAAAPPAIERRPEPAHVEATPPSEPPPALEPPVGVAPEVPATPEEDAEEPAVEQPAAPEPARSARPPRNGARQTRPRDESSTTTVRPRNGAPRQGGGFLRDLDY